MRRNLSLSSSRHLGVNLARALLLLLDFFKVTKSVYEDFPRPKHNRF
jgi:hypothetical protein